MPVPSRTQHVDCFAIRESSNFCTFEKRRGLFSLGSGWFWLDERILLFLQWVLMKQNEEKDNEGKTEKARNKGTLNVILFPILCSILRNQENNEICAHAEKRHPEKGNQHNSCFAIRLFKYYCISWIPLPQPGRRQRKQRCKLRVIDTLVWLHHFLSPLPVKESKQTLFSFVEFLPLFRPCEVTLGKVLRRILLVACSPEYKTFTLFSAPIYFNHACLELSPCIFLFFQSFSFAQKPGLSEISMTPKNKGTIL